MQCGIQQRHAGQPSILYDTIKPVQLKGKSFRLPNTTMPHFGCCHLEDMLSKGEGIRTSLHMQCIDLKLHRKAFCGCSIKLVKDMRRKCELIQEQSSRNITTPLWSELPKSRCNIATLLA